MQHEEILKYFVQTDYKEYIRFIYQKEHSIDLTPFVDNEISFLIHCIDDLGQLTLQRAILPKAYDYFPELNEWLPSVTF